MNLADCQSCSHCENLIKCKGSQPDSVLLRPSIHNGFNSPCAVSLPVNGNNILKVNAVLELEHIIIITLIYHKVASSTMSRLEAHVVFFRLLMKGIFDPYVL